MFTIGRHTDYAARIVLHLACLEPGARVTAREIAVRRLIPPAFIRRIISRLSAAGLLTTTRGSGGGIALAREASANHAAGRGGSLRRPVVAQRVRGATGGLPALRDVSGAGGLGEGHAPPIRPLVGSEIRGPGERDAGRHHPRRHESIGLRGSRPRCTRRSAKRADGGMAINRGGHSMRHSGNRAGLARTGRCAWMR